MNQRPPDPQFERLPSGYVHHGVFLRDSTIHIPVLSAISTGVHWLSCQLSAGGSTEAMFCLAGLLIVSVSIGGTPGEHRAGFAAVSCITVCLIGRRFPRIQQDYSCESLSIRDFHDKASARGLCGRHWTFCSGNLQCRPALLDESSPNGGQTSLSHKTVFAAM